MKFSLKKPNPNNIEEQKAYHLFKLKLTNYSSNIIYDDKHPLYDIVHIDISEIENEEEFNKFLSKFRIEFL